MPKRSRAFLSVSLLLLGLSGCASVRAYGKARLDDVWDVIDLKWSVGRDNMGFGVKVEPLVFLGSGIGYANLGAVQEEFGRARRSRKLPSATGMRREFSHIGVLGGDTYGGSDDLSPPVDFNLLLFNWCPYWDDKLSPMQYLSLAGGEIVFPWFYGGMYFNTGELIDFLAGIFGLDPAGDDRLSEEDDGDE